MGIKIKLDELLSERNISIREFSRMIDHHHEQVRLLCRGELKRLPVDVLEKTCRKLNVTLDEIISYEEGEMESETNEDAEDVGECSV